MHALECGIQTYSQLLRVILHVRGVCGFPGRVGFLVGNVLADREKTPSKKRICGYEYFGRGNLSTQSLFISCLF